MDVSAPTQGDPLFSLLKPNQNFYGAPVGILTLERTASRPGIRHYIPGSVGNASTWSVPVRYKTVVGHSYARLIDGTDQEAEAALVEAAVELEREGARLITSNCGFMVRHQKAVQAAVEAPVLLSSLLLSPLLQATLPDNKSIGIITAKGASLTSDVLEAAGLQQPFSRVVIAGLEDYPAFSAAFLTGYGDLDVAAVEAETVDAAIALVNRRPDVAMVLLECSELPPYAAAVQRATGVPVFDFTSLIEFFIAGSLRRPFRGVY